MPAKCNLAVVEVAAAPLLTLGDGATDTSRAPHPCVPHASSAYDRSRRRRQRRRAAPPPSGGRICAAWPKFPRQGRCRRAHTAQHARSPRSFTRAGAVAAAAQAGPSPIVTSTITPEGAAPPTLVEGDAFDDAWFAVSELGRSVTDAPPSDGPQRPRGGGARACAPAARARRRAGHRGRARLCRAELAHARQRGCDRAGCRVAL